MTSTSNSPAFKSRCRARIRASLPPAMHRGWDAGMAIGSVDDLIL
jgi:hypothetical protein